MPSLATCLTRAAPHAFFKMDKDEIGSCYAIRDFNLVPAEFCPKIDLQANLVKDTDWDEANIKIALIAIPTLALQ
jgi:hypothetical protein